MLSRDHHDVSGTDSPFRETSNIHDGSMFCAGEQGILLGDSRAGCRFQLLHQDWKLKDE